MHTPRVCKWIFKLYGLQLKVPLSLTARRFTSLEQKRSHEQEQESLNPLTLANNSSSVVHAQKKISSSIDNQNNIMQVVHQHRRNHLLLLLLSSSSMLLALATHSLSFAPPHLSLRQRPSLKLFQAITRMTPLSASSSPSNNKDNDNNLILVVGSANQDLTSHTNIIPKLGETVMGNSFGTACGGKGANCAVAAASIGQGLGVPVQMTCRVGSDIFGQNLLKNFRKVGVKFNEEETVLQDIESGVASIIVEGKSGDNSIIVTPGANFKLTPNDVKKAVKDARPAMVVSQLEVKPDVAYVAMKTGKEMGAVTILNSAPAPEGYTLEDPGRNFYQYIDVLILNESELEKLCEQSGADSKNSEEELAKFLLLEKNVGKAVIVTLGSRGAMIVEKDGHSDIKTSYADAPEDLPARNEPVVNTVGAGDSFCGCLVSYWSTGMSLPSAARYACGVASMTVRKDGAQSSYPKYDELPPCLKLGEEVIGSKRLKMSKPTLTFVTGNQKKLEEVRQILNKGGAEVPFEITNKKIDLPELQGDPVEIAKEKCRLASKEVNGPVFTEDTSLCFNALNGLPGPYIKWFLEKCGHDGLNRMLDGFSDRSAYAQTIIAFTSGPDDEIHIFDGRTDGTIVQPRGSLEFGWDPVFEPVEGNGKTYAEMAKDVKNQISHRSRSMEKFRSFLVTEHCNDDTKKKASTTEMLSAAS